MEEIFVTNIRINKVRHLEGLTIPLSDTERKHLILTGKNGSGKTSVLQEMKRCFNLINQHSFYENQPSEKNVPVFIEFENGDKINNSFYGGFFIVAYFKAKRKLELVISNGPEKVNFKTAYTSNEKINKYFIQHLVNLRYDRLDFKDQNKTEKVAVIEKWQNDFEQILRKLFDDETLYLDFVRSSYNFNIITKGHKPFTLKELSDGYCSVLDIIAEILLRAENKSINAYDLQGIVLIDEIETHLHIDLQKKILPFLTSFFPKIQFIVTTHSPFVLSSIDNAVIYDLEKQEEDISDFSAYSYSSIVKGYFGTDEYSKELKDKVADYEQLIHKSDHDTTNLTIEEKEQYYNLKRYFEELPKSLSPELQLKIQQLELADLAQ
jgi:predicted ATP-binding protein involved in virulence